MKKKKRQAFPTLIKEFFGYLNKLQRSEKTIGMYSWIFRKLKAYMDQNHLRYYDEVVEKKYLESALGAFDYLQLSDSGKRFVNTLGTLTEFQETGSIVYGIKRQPPKVFSGEVGATMTDFMAYRKVIYNLSDSTLKDYTSYLHNLLVFLNNEGVVCISRITVPIILKYISSLDCGKNPTRNRKLLLIKNYLMFLYEQKLLPVDYSGCVPKGNSINRPQLPSTFSVEEIKTLLESIDRSSPGGKRDYAILLLATKLGMRSSDIRWLKFEYIFWQQNMLMFKQQKTGKSITLPLLPEVGNAIIDYLQHGRPVSDESYLFLHLRSPYPHIGRTTIGSLVYFHLRRAGINCSNRKYGPHALRHSLAGTLLNKKTPIPVISEVLGHSHTDSTMNYLRIDKDTLNQCALDVPNVPASFYLNSKGGLYHG
ncbi:MAG TPA: site-specific integrase [Hanamia sp.]|nr:site-specific integrase [Hanamia sp.]